MRLAELTVLNRLAIPHGGLYQFYISILNRISARIFGRCIGDIDDICIEIGFGDLIYGLVKPNLAKIEPAIVVKISRYIDRNHSIVYDRDISEVDVTDIAHVIVVCYQISFRYSSCL